jgi:putative membrane protein
MLTNQSRMLILLMAMLLSFMTSLTYAQGSGSTGELAQRDIEFIKHAAVGGKLEIQLGKVAQNRAQHSEVRQFGEQMVEDHNKAVKKLKQLTADLNVQLPKTLPENKESLKNALSELDKESFDKEYLWNMIAAHTIAVNRFEDAAENGQHPKVVNFAEQTLPTLKEHRERVIQIWNQLGY